MNRFQIVEVTEEFNHAGTKATEDVALIAEEMGFKKEYIKMRNFKGGFSHKVQRQIGFFIDYKRLYNNIPEKAVLLVQNPFHHKQLTRTKVLSDLKKNKNVRIISLVHDVEELREIRYNKYYKKEFEDMLELADAIILHNQVMEDFFISKGVDKKKLVNLQIFDYIHQQKGNKIIHFKKSISIAGNLDIKKAGYISQLADLNGIEIRLYGPNYNVKDSMPENIKYFGSFPVNEIPDCLDTGFGLVWDGDSINGCEGKYGQYLKFNSPHKLSLYLSAGLPVIIWEKAAEAAFVKENNIGFCVNNLLDIKDIFSGIMQSEYYEIIQNVQLISKKLKEGYFTKEALDKALRLTESF